MSDIEYTRKVGKRWSVTISTKGIITIIIAIILSSYLGAQTQATFHPIPESQSTVTSISVSTVSGQNTVSMSTVTLTRTETSLSTTTLTSTFVSYPKGKNVTLTLSNYTSTNEGGLLVGEVSTSYRTLDIYLPSPQNYLGSAIYFSASNLENFSPVSNCSQINNGICFGKAGQIVSVTVQGGWVGIGQIPNGSSVTIFESPF